MDVSVMYGIGVLSILNLFFLITSIFYWITFTKISKGELRDGTNTLQYVASTPTTYDFTKAALEVEDGDNMHIELANALDYDPVTNKKTIYLN